MGENPMANICFLQTWNSAINAVNLLPAAPSGISPHMPVTAFALLIFIYQVKYASIPHFLFQPRKIWTADSPYP